MKYDEQWKNVDSSSKLNSKLKFKYLIEYYWFWRVIEDTTRFEWKEE